MPEKYIRFILFRKKTSGSPKGSRRRGFVYSYFGALNVLVGLALVFAICLPTIAQRGQTESTAGSQPKHIFTGIVLDKDNNEPLPGATVYIPRLKKGVVTDVQGKFLVGNLPADTVSVRFSYTGFAVFTKVYNLRKKVISTDVVLLTATISNDVEITDMRSTNEEINSFNLGKTQVTVTDAKLLPSLAGEVDLFKTLQLKPGVQSGSEGSSGLYIRGGGPDQNLTILDEAPVYNASHLFGFFSVFNGDALKGIDLYKGNFPASYGGRLSSVVQVNMKEGDAEKLHGGGSIGLISSRLNLEGPIKRGASSFLVTARRTYFDIFSRYLNNANQNKANYTPLPDYYFYDLTGKADFRLGPRDKITFSGYYGRDNFTLSRNNFTVNFDWGNIASTLKWFHVANAKTAVTTALTFSNYDYRIRNNFGAYSFQLGSAIADIGFKNQVSYSISDKTILVAGGSYTLHKFTIARASGGTQDGAISFNNAKYVLSSEVGLFAELEHHFSAKFKAMAGLRLSGFSTGNAVYGAPEPRLQLNYSVTPFLSLKAGYARMLQYTHLVSSSGASLPNDLWYPSTKNVKPQISDQATTGYQFSFGDGKYVFSNEVYYKYMQRQIDYKNGADLSLNQSLDTTFIFGNGWSYGAEFYLEKKTGKTRGWVGYTLAYAWRKFPDINNGEDFHPRYDRRHDISMVLIQQLTKRLTISATWVFGSGNVISLPEGRFLYQDVQGTALPGNNFAVVPDIQKRNNYRMEPYHRLDIGMVYTLKPKRGTADLTFSVFNVYNRANPYFIYINTIKQNPDGTGSVTGFQAKQVSLFPIIPSISYTYRF